MCAAGAGFIGVGLGAFAAHGLRARLEPALLTVFEDRRALPDVSRVRVDGGGMGMGAVAAA